MSVNITFFPRKTRNGPTLLTFSDSFESVSKDPLDKNEIYGSIQLGPSTIVDATIA